MEKQEYANIFNSEDEHWWYVGMREIFISLVGKYLKSGLRILDTGCGTGKNAELLATFGKVFGVDISDEAIRFSKKRKVKYLINASANNLPFKDNSFDFITSFDVIYHAKVNDSAAVREMLRVCKPKGFAFIRVPALKSLMRAHDKIVHTKKRYALKELEFLLKKAGFKIIRITYANFFLFPLVYFAKGDGSDIKETGTFLNSILKFTLRIEAFLLKYLDFPLGVSLIAFAQKLY